MNPRLFINIHYLEIGGAERALLGLLNALDPAKVDVDLFVNQHTGEFMRYVPEHVRLLPEDRRYASIEAPMAQVVRRGYIDIVMARLLARAAHWAYRRRQPLAAGQEDAAIFHYVGKYTTPLLPSLRRYGHYDLAISFLTPHQVVAAKVDAAVKVAWIHTDYTISKVNTVAELPVWASYDYIASISPDVTRTFLQEFPSLAPKIVEVENILSPAFVRSLAEEFDATPEISGGGNVLVDRKIRLSEELRGNPLHLQTTHRND